MSIHVCKCDHNGTEEQHLRYPGMSREWAQRLADKINGGWLDALKRHADHITGNHVCYAELIAAASPCRVVELPPILEDFVRRAKS